MRVLAGAQPQYPQQQQPGPRMTPAPARFMTVVGQPKTIALQYATGKSVRSRINNEEQMLYTLTTGEKAYFPLNVGVAIDALRLTPGEPFTVCHYGRGEWDISRAQAASSQPPPFVPPPPVPAAAASQPLMNGAGETVEAILARSYAAAIDLTLGAIEAARAKGLQILPTHEGLQACAATLFIAETRRQQ